MKLFFLPIFGVPCCEKMSSEAIVRLALKTGKLLQAQSPIQAELMLIIGGVTQKQAPHLQNLWSQFVFPAFCIYLEGCEKRLRNYSMVDDPSSIVKIDHTLCSCEIDQQIIHDAIVSLGKSKR